MAPPVQYIQDCPEPSAPARPVTNAALAQYAKATRDVLRACNTDKAALREWSAGIEEPNH